MFLEFPEERRRTGKVVPEPAPLAQVPSPGTDIGLSTHIPRTEGIMFWLYRYLDKAGYWMTAGLRFGCEYPAYLAIRYGFIHVSWCMWRRGGRRRRVGMLSLVGGGRVATQTTKAWMLAGQSRWTSSSLQP